MAFIIADVDFVFAAGENQVVKKKHMNLKNGFITAVDIYLLKLCFVSVIMNL